MFFRIGPRSMYGHRTIRLMLRPLTRVAHPPGITICIYTYTYTYKQTIHTKTHSHTERERERERCEICWVNRRRTDATRQWSSSNSLLHVLSISSLTAADDGEEEEEEEEEESGDTDDLFSLLSLLSLFSLLSLLSLARSNARKDEIWAWAELVTRLYIYIYNIKRLLFN